MLKHTFFKINSYEKQKKVHDLVVFILKMFQFFFFFFAVFILQKIAENHKYRENFQSQKFLFVRCFHIRAGQISLYTPEFLGGQIYLPALIWKRKKWSRKTKVRVRSKTYKEHCFLFFFTQNELAAFIFNSLPSKALATWILFECLKKDASQTIIFIF